MFFLLRLAFWIGLVLVLLPRDRSGDDAAKAPQIGAADAVSAATAAINDMSQFCTRQPAACEIGGKAATEVGHRAQGGAKKIFQIITDKKSDTTGSIAGDSTDETQPPHQMETLTAEDMQIEWSLAPATTGAN
jgi:hypothetical protein